MPDCEYCDSSFEDRNAYLSHLDADHDRDELSRIDQRRIESSDVGGDGLIPDIDVGKVALVVLAGVLFGGMLGYVAFGTPGGSSNLAGDVKQKPTGVGNAHYHAEMTLTIDGEQVDFSKSKYQLQADAVHFETGNGQKVHVHAEKVTIEYLFATLGFEITSSSFESDDMTVTEDGAGTVEVIVNGTEVDPQTYVIQPDDEIRVIVESA